MRSFIDSDYLKENLIGKIIVVSDGVLTLSNQDKNLGEQMNNTLKTALTIIAINLIIGNGILFLGGKSSFGEDVNYPLMIGMSIACVVIYFLFFNYLNFKIYGNLKLIFLSILSCMAIIFLGNFLALLINQPIKEVIDHLPATIFMGMMGNIILFPISVTLGLLNFGIMTYFKSR